MDKLRIIGGQKLSGTIPISGAKNSALTLIPCALLWIVGSYQAQLRQAYFQIR